MSKYTKEEKKALKEYLKPKKFISRGDSDAKSLGALIGREKELSSFEITQEQIDRYKNEFGIDIS